MKFPGRAGFTQSTDAIAVRQARMATVDRQSSNRTLTVTGFTSVLPHCGELADVRDALPERFHYRQYI